MYEEKASTRQLGHYLKELAEGLDEYLLFESSDAMENAEQWQEILGGPAPESGVGIDQVIREINNTLLPNASVIPKPGFSSFITTGASNVGVLAGLSAAVASPQRFNLTAFNYLEELSLDWMRDLFSLHPDMKGVYCSGGSTANIIALGAARQRAFETLGFDPAKTGVNRPCRIYASAGSHRTIHRAAGVLGMGSDSVIHIPVDNRGALDVSLLARQLENDATCNDAVLPVALVANAGTTDTGAVDPISEVACLAEQYGLWLHIDGAYGLPGILDENVAPLYAGIEKADSVTVDPHKWLGAPVGTGATFVRDREILYRAFKQGEAPYLEGSFNPEDAVHSMDSMGTPWGDLGLELSAPARGVVVWAILKEIGREGFKARVCRHNAMARHLADRVRAHPDLELVVEPTLSICCFRYAGKDINDLNDFNRRIHRQLVRNGNNIPSTTVINGKLVIRPCFIGARASWEQADELLDEFLSLAEKSVNK